MLSELIHSRLSYPAVPLAGQQAHQWSVQLGPLVLESNPLKNRTPAVDRRPTCLTLVALMGFHLFLSAMDYIFILRLRSG